MIECIGKCTASGYKSCRRNGRTRSRLRLERQCRANGIFRFLWICQDCGAVVSGEIKKAVVTDLCAKAGIDPNALPEYHSPYSRESRPCEVTGCGSNYTEWHHWAPWSVFKSAGAGDRPGAEWWPTSYLCRKHHRMWHSRMNRYHAGLYLPPKFAVAAGDTSVECAVHGCDSSKTMWTYFAPYDVFHAPYDPLGAEEGNDREMWAWPGAYLCAVHHAVWHRVMLTEYGKPRLHLTPAEIARRLATPRNYGMSSPAC